jgi:signal transduction histidine kinase
VKRIEVRSIAFELIILFAALLIVTTVLAIGHRTLLRTEALNALEAIRIADRLAVIASLLEATEPDRRMEVIQHFRGSNMPVTLADHSWIDEQMDQEDQDAKTRHLRYLLSLAIPHSDNRDIRIGYSTAVGGFAMADAAALAQVWRQAQPVGSMASIVEQLTTDPTFVVSLQLSDGTWINVVAAYAVTVDFWELEEIGLIGLMVIAIAALSIWAIRRLTSPFRVFAEAAGRLGGDVQAPPIQEGGPSEVREAIRAFNEMQTRLKRFLEDRTQMLASISHDLRTPITRLRLRAEFIELPVQRQKHLADLSQMDQMIGELLSFAKDEASAEPSVRVDLAALLQSICDDMSDRGQPAVLINDRRVPYDCRRVALRRCFTNLLENAVEYGQEAIVTIDVTEDKVQVNIDDCGPGIPPELHELAFRPFQRLEPSRSRDTGGTGLGLAVARSIARAHGGDTTLSNRSQGGLRASVVLPLHSKSTTSPSREAASITS